MLWVERSEIRERSGSFEVRKIYATVLSDGEALTKQLAAGRPAWVQVARGSVALNGQKLKAGDGAAITTEGTLKPEGLADAELLLFDVALQPN